MRAAISLTLVNVQSFKWKNKKTLENRPLILLCWGIIYDFGQKMINICRYNIVKPCCQLSHVATGHFNVADVY